MARPELVLVGLPPGQCVLDPFARAGQVLFAAFGELFASLPEFQRRVQIQATLLESLHDFDELIPRLFVAQFANRFRHDALSGPSLMAMTAPSDTRTRNLVPGGAPSADRNTVAAPESGTVCTTA